MELPFCMVCNEVVQRFLERPLVPELGNAVQLVQARSTTGDVVVLLAIGLLIAQVLAAHGIANACAHQIGQPIDGDLPVPPDIDNLPNRVG